MGRFTSTTSAELRKKVENELARRRKLAIAAATLVGHAVIQYPGSLYNKARMHTSILSGEARMQELLSGHPITFYNTFGMSVPVFKHLLSKLHQYTSFYNSRHVSMIEQLGIFLWICRKGASVRDAMYIFQRSPDTISKYFYRVLHCIMAPSFYKQYVFLPDPDQVQSRIAHDPKFFPFFKDVLGALDGTHIDAFVNDKDIARFRNRKGAVSQNVLVVCTFDGRASFVLSGWEGSATNARVLADAKKRGFIIPSGKIYLADAGYSLQSDVLTPYRQVRYHLKEWGRATEKPQNAKELFNLRHSTACNCIERFFGVVKRRFRIVGSAPEYSLQTQARIIHAICALHNFILGYDLTDATIHIVAKEIEKRNSTYCGTLARTHSYNDSDLEVEGNNNFEVINNTAEVLRDQIAADMWEQYQAYIAEA